MTQQNNRRKQYFIDKPFQKDFIIRFCLLVFLGGAAAMALLYFLSMRSTTVAIVHSRVTVKSTADFILPVLVQTVGIVSICVGAAMILLTLYISHRIAGPLFRLKKAMRLVAQGDYTVRLTFRKDDSFYDVAEEFNDMVSNIRNKG